LGSNKAIKCQLLEKISSNEAFNDGKEFEALKYLTLHHIA
jgi:hypothetical protein